MRSGISEFATVFATLVFVAGATATKAADKGEVLLGAAVEPWTGDLDEIVDRGFLRVVTAYNPLFYTYDETGKAVGLVAETAHEFEKFLNDSLESKDKSVDVIVYAVPRDEILDYIVEGRADIADANLTITAERSEIVNFTSPLLHDVSEVVVSGPGLGNISSIDDLSSTALHLRRSSSYFTHVQDLNFGRAKAGLAEIPVVAVDEYLEDHDILDLVDEGVFPATIVDSHKAELWSQVFENIIVHEDLSVNDSGQIAWALRQDTPRLMEAANAFSETVKKGTLLGNILLDRYFSNPEGIDALRNPDRHQDLSNVIEVFQEYSDQYGFDWLMIFAQAFQESKLDQSKRSAAGAIGIMQVLPSTAADPNVAVSGIEELENNVHAGVRYLRFIKDRYFDQPDMTPTDQILFSFAAYNAGPRRIAKIRAEAQELGFDPNIWFGNVEVVAAKSISREPVVYVRNIFRYYVAYQHLVSMREGRQDKLDAQASE